MCGILNACLSNPPFTELREGKSIKSLEPSSLSFSNYHNLLLNLLSKKNTHNRDMRPPHPQPLFSLYNDQSPPRPRHHSTASSIWAPQPQPSETTWPRAIDTFSDFAENRFNPQSRQSAAPASVDPAKNVSGKEDGLGPFGFFNPRRSKEFGAIGDGRKKNSVEFDDGVCSFFLSFVKTSFDMMLFAFAFVKHVEQLLRTL